MEWNWYEEVACSIGREMAECDTDEKRDVLLRLSGRISGRAMGGNGWDQQDCDAFYELIDNYENEERTNAANARKYARGE